MCADAARDVPYFAKCGVGREDAAGIVQIGDDDQLCFGADGFADCGGIYGVAFAFEAREGFDFSVEIFRGGDE